MHEDLNKALQKIKCEDLENNICILSSYKNKLEEYIDNKHKPFFNNDNDDKKKAMDLVFHSLFSRLSNNSNTDEKEKFISAQCVSIITQINKIISPNSSFRKMYPDDILNSKVLVNITKELIFDIRRFSEENNLAISQDKTIRDYKIPSIDFYKQAKFSFFCWNPQPLTNRNFYLANAISNIRLAIDSKLFEMIGFQMAFDRKGRSVSLKVTELMSLFSKEENKKLFPNIPVDFKLLKKIYDWSSEYIHNVEPHFSWQVLHAIDILEPLFCMKERQNGSSHIFGMSYLSREVDIKDLKELLERETKYQVYLNDNFYRES